MKHNIKTLAKYVAVAMFASTAIISCDQDLEGMNENPNLTAAPLTYGIFNSANKAITDATRNSFESGRVTLPWVQYSAQRNYTDEDRYQYRLTSGDALWSALYRAAGNYKVIIDLNSDPSTAATTSVYGPNANQIAASRVMLSYIFLQLADSFGDIPYWSYGNTDPDFQALSIDTTIQPKFASQQKVYADILKELKEAAAMVEQDEVVFTNGDILFGSGKKLVKFANSLRLKVATRVKGVVPGAEAHLAEAIAGGVMTSNDDNVGVTYDDNLTNPSPMYLDLMTRSDFSVSKTFIDLLKGDTGSFGLDPRLFKYASPMGTLKATILAGTSVESTNIADFVGQPYGLDQSLSASQNTKANFFSKNVYKKDYTEMLMEYSEVEFLLAEANGWAQTNYENGVRASMQKWGVSGADIESFIATLPAANKANVLNQKYVALYMQPYEAWAEYRRTGYPDNLLLPGQTATLSNPLADGTTTYTFNSLIAGLTDLPTRLFYPTTIQTLNVTNYQAAAQAIGGDKMNTKLIWDKN